jgi:hypothetical protein
VIIRTSEGRARTVRTPEERRAALLRRMAGLPRDERRLLEVLLYEEQAGRAEIANECHAKRYRITPVDMATFIDDPYYLGESCQTIYPVLRRRLIEIFEPGAHYREVILGGAIGYGKTFVLSVIVGRLLYELSCLVNPQASYGLSPGSEMSLILVSKNLVLSRQVLKSAVDNKIELSPYFQEHFKPDVRGEVSYFPNNVQLIVASYLAQRDIGTNAIACFLDETNFVRTNKQQIRTADGQQKSLAHFDLAEKTYRSLERRIKSRFVQASGDLPGMIVMVSSANTVGSFIDRRLAAAHHDPSIYAMEMATWEVKPPGSFSGRRFKVLCGGSSLRSRILAPGEVVDPETLPDEARVIAVPEEYRVDFESNLEDAIRDIAGVPTTAISTFIQRTEKIQEAVNPQRRHPADRQTWQYGQPLVIYWHQLAKASVRRLPGGFEEEVWTPLRNPKALRYVHVDTSLSGDCTGISLGHIERWVEVVRRTPEGDHYTDLAPSFVLDLVLQVRPPPGEQIQLADIRAVIYDLQAHGFVLIGFSTDQYQAVDTIQHMKRRGVAAEILSVDATMVPYEALRSAIYERRIELYEHAPLLGELRALEHDRLRGKVDHPVAGGKDCLSGETMIVFLDGRQGAMKDLVGREFWVYACNQEGHVVPARARNVHLVGEQAMIRLWLESGAHIDCTPDHEILLWAGTFCEAHGLQPGDLLMPLYWCDPTKRPKQCVARVEPLPSGPVYDLTVDVHHNFAIGAGVFVHNCADAVAGVVAGLMKKVPRVPLGVLQPGEGRAEAEDFAWVTGQPGPDGEAEGPVLPFLMG